MQNLGFEGSETVGGDQVVALRLCVRENNGLTSRSYVVDKQVDEDLSWRRARMNSCR